MACEVTSLLQVSTVWTDVTGLPSESKLSHWNKKYNIDTFYEMAIVKILNGEW
jgi:hypothetical protein